MGPDAPNRLLNALSGLSSGCTNVSLATIDT
jgi:hypothetical protein